MGGKLIGSNHCLIAFVFTRNVRETVSCKIYGISEEILYSVSSWIRRIVTKQVKRIQVSSQPNSYMNQYV